VSRSFARQTAIVGIGATEFSKNSGRSELQLAGEAVLAAVADAGLTPGDVDGLTTFTMETNSEIEVARTAGLGDLTFFSKIGYGGGAACATVQQAAIAVATGVADVVVCYRAFNERSGHRFGSGAHRGEPTAEGIAMSWVSSFGLMTPASWVAMFAQRYMHEYGATSEDFGRVSVADRKHAATNPKAWFYGKPITLEEHQASRLIVDPLRLLDCCQETDGGQAMVIVSTERARDLKHPPVVVRGAAQGIGPQQISMSSFSRPRIEELPEVRITADQLWRQSGLTPADMDAAVVYDAFTPMVLVQLEEYGFCGRGEAKDFIADGHGEVDGSLPLNTHGGQLGEGYLHGVNGIAEGVRLVRGTSTNQPATAVENVLVTAGSPVPTSGLVLGVDR
jgi:acetyl-CoA acetyltransferase